MHQFCSKSCLKYYINGLQVKFSTSCLLCFFPSVCMWVCDFQAQCPHRAPPSWANEIWVKVVLRCAAVKLLTTHFAAATRGNGTEKEEEKEEEDGWCEEGSSFWPFKTGLCKMTKLRELMLKVGQTLTSKWVQQSIGTLLYKCWLLL